MLAIFGALDAGKSEYRCWSVWFEVGDGTKHTWDRQVEQLHLDGVDLPGQFARIDSLDSGRDLREMLFINGIRPFASAKSQDHWRPTARGIRT